METTEVITGRTAAEVLAESRTAVDPGLRAAAERLPGSMRRIVGYHFGWTDEHGDPATAPAGKAIRPALVLLAAQAMSDQWVSDQSIPPSRATAPAEGRPEQTLAAAVAVELVHNFSLLHDDVMDGDLTRRHRPTAWAIYGTNSAILAGDALVALAMEVLAGSRHPAVAEAIQLLSTAVQDLVEGQSIDMSFQIRSDVDMTECLTMVNGKTSALLACSCALGALYGGGTPQQVKHLRSFGELLGLAFQFVDDLLGIWGDPATTGKSVYSDLDARKKSLPVVAALSSGTAAGHELARLYRIEEPLSNDELARAAELIDLTGARAWSQTRARELIAQARRELDAAGPRPRAAEELQALANLVVTRDH
jgi:geranylgeranyl diphosphate synthase type I